MQPTFVKGKHLLWNHLELQRRYSLTLFSRSGLILPMTKTFAGPVREGETIRVVLEPEVRGNVFRFAVYESPGVRLAHHTLEIRTERRGNTIRSTRSRTLQTNGEGLLFLVLEDEPEPGIQRALHFSALIRDRRFGFTLDQLEPADHDAQTTREVLLEEIPRVVSGHVLSERGEGLSGARIQLYVKGRKLTEGMTSARGRFQLNDPTDAAPSPSVRELSWLCRHVFDLRTTRGESGDPPAARRYVTSALGGR